MSGKFLKVFISYFYVVNSVGMQGLERLDVDKGLDFG